MKGRKIRAMHVPTLQYMLSEAKDARKKAAVDDRESWDFVLAWLEPYMDPETKKKKPYYSITEVARMMDVSRNTALKRLRKANVILEQWRPRARFRIGRGELEVLLKRFTTNRDIFGLDHIYDRKADRKKSL